MCGIGGKKASSFSFPLSFSLFHEYTIRLFGPERGNAAAALFFWNNGAIFGGAEMEIYLITDTDARVTAVVVRTCGLFCPTWITR